MPQKTTACTCGKTFNEFRYYREHIIKYKCHLKHPQSPPESPKSRAESDDLTLQNININLDNITSPVAETQELVVSELQPEKIAYNSNSSNINPKVNCSFCDKLYSRHHIKTHKSKCKQRYKDTYEYKLLLRAGIPNIPETYRGPRIIL